MCGAVFEFDSWQLSIHEGMARYQVVHGLKPIGRHKKLANAVLGSKWANCGECDGDGIHTISIDLWEPCRACKGMGGRWSCSPKKVRKARQAVLKSYPEAAVSGGVRNFMGAPLAQHMKSGEMVDLRDVQAPKEDPTPEYDEWVYGTANDSLIFLPRTIALELAQLWDALGSSTTWGEFRSRVPEARYREALERVRDHVGDGPRPPDDAEFPGSDLLVASGRAYPEWPAQRMLVWLPREILRPDYGRVESLSLNGLFLRLDPDREAAIVSRLRELGYEVSQDRALVLRACGRVP